jgi:hypothetical protein
MFFFSYLKGKGDTISNTRCPARIRLRPRFIQKVCRQSFYISKYMELLLFKSLKLNLDVIISL